MVVAASLEEEYFSEPKEFRDPVHGDIRLYKYEIAIVNTRPFQRLRGIKQLSACELVWFGATHTRFQHSIGTLGMVEKMLESLDKRGYEIRPALRVVVRLFALLHDIGHVPFGHTLEDERPVIREKHDDEARISRILDGELSEILSQVEALFSEEDRRIAGMEAHSETRRRSRMSHTLRDVLALLITSAKGESVAEEPGAAAPARYRLFLDLVGNTVCADLFDYLYRDTYFTGLRRAYDEKILSHLVIWRDRLAVDLGQPRRATDQADASMRTRGGIVTEISNLLRVRYTLAERVYFNDTKAGASAMVSQAVEYAGVEVEALGTMRDDQLLCLVESADICSKYEANRAVEHDRDTPVPEDHSLFSDLFGQEILELWQHISSRPEPPSSDDRESARKLMQAYRRRNIFRPVYRIRAEDVNIQKRNLLCSYLHDIKHTGFRTLVQRWLAEASGVAPWQVILYCPAPQMNVKIAKTLIGPLPGGTYKEMAELSDEDVNGNDALRILREEACEVQRLHMALWSMEVLVDPEAPDATQRYVSACSTALFGHRNALIPDLGSGLSLDDIRRNNLRRACATANMDYTVELEDELIHVRARGPVSFTPADFAQELQTQERDTEQLF